MNVLDFDDDDFPSTIRGSPWFSSISKMVIGSPINTVRKPSSTPKLAFCLSSRLMAQSNLTYLSFIFPISSSFFGKVKYYSADSCAANVKASHYRLHRHGASFGKTGGTAKRDRRQAGYRQNRKQPVTLEGASRMLLYKCLKFSSLWKMLLLDWG